MDYMAEYRRWLEETKGNRELACELEEIKDAPAAIEDRFYRELEFGTGGLRGVLGAGTNRMNIYTVGKATQGYSNYLNKNFSKPSVAIAYDSRINSELFARRAASVFAANGVEVKIYPKLMPTPALSFAVRDKNCSGGIVITASHNPAKYNGYKVYGKDGCQITTQAAKAIQEEIDAVEPFRDVLSSDFEAGLSSGLISFIGEDTVTRYLNAVSSASVLPQDVIRDISIIYSPLNGAGITCVPRILSENGFSNVIIPEEQGKPDGNFPTCPYPNPEMREALSVCLNWAERTGSELLLATDPDCDRVGAAVRYGEGYELINGNEMGVLLLDFICARRKENGTMPENPIAIKTIVTTPMAGRIAQNYGVRLIDVLTGFKFIGEQIGLLEEKGEDGRFIFGFEESYGYLSGSFVRDKDAVNASLLICEMFAWYKALGKSPIDVLGELSEQYGHFVSRLLSFTFEGSAGFEKMSRMIDSIRLSPPRDICGRAVVEMTDYLGEGTGLPSSNVLRLYLEGGAEVVVRPSGTEPKLKVYLTTAENTKERSEALIEQLAEHFTVWAH